MPQLSEAMHRYRALEDDLRLIRSENPPGSPQEEPILEEMARLWWDLSDIERQKLDDEGPTCWPEAVVETVTDLKLTDTEIVDGQIDSPLRSRSSG
jgi:hypothetical protein